MNKATINNSSSFLLFSQLYFQTTKEGFFAGTDVNAENMNFELKKATQIKQNLQG
jgi:hypothetical protein